ncbi:MAG: hypothetical protein QGG73_04145 [Candidatus Hydrogenedentes bacterium]|jgi:hypothetical protein|nr:hypothetical protein [Candidatus Hydrogenedentota bacterium]
MNKYWANLSERERSLALTTLGLTSLILAVLIGTRAVARIADLDDRIADLERSLYNLAEQDARGASIQQAFHEVAAEHSSKWTEQEIHRRLDLEILRLALKDPYPPGTEPPEGSMARQNRMVEIPTLREGTLNTEGDGYREYTLPIKVSPAEPEQLFRFIERLQSSRQFLRINSLELTRPFNRTAISANLEVTRTVVDSIPDDTEYVHAARVGNLVKNPSFEEEGGESGLLHWLVPGCTVERSLEHATEGKWSAKAITELGEGQLYQRVMLDGGTTYQIEADITALSTGELGVLDPDRGSAFAGAKRLPGDGKTYHYEVQFVAPGSPGSSAEVFAPHLTIANDGGGVFVDNIALMKVGD